MIENNNLLPVFAATAADQKTAGMLAERLGSVCFEIRPEQPFLECSVAGVALVFPQEPNWQPLRVDFADPAWRHRQRQISWRKEQIARAVGMGRDKNLSIVDATAGLGQDAYVLALLGAQVTCIERSPVIAALLADGIDRLQQAKLAGADNVELVQADAANFLTESLGKLSFDVVYLDPMYPGRDAQSALQKKSLRMLRQIVGEDMDADSLLEPALALASKRVVVKRPKQAGFLCGREPQLQLKGSSSRFDVYLIET
jgi:16S rRNA (guanine1516-N2)-methyltransferase